ncbi:MAG TPA: MBL fold metallo-hydrolase [Bryobacteraceae bacterium]|nr:MBL fold metallo-hydrolase [Bryobacteraceae bacterium]
MKMLAGLLLVAVASFAQIKRPVQEFETTAGSVKITPVQHASLMIEAGGQVIHLDPWSNGNYDGLPPADLILITDIHGDHMDPKMVSKEAKPGSMILAPAAVAETVKNATVIRNGETKTAGPFTIEAVPMYNLKRGPEAGKLFHDKGRGNGYVVAYGGKRFYFSGDTEGIPEMRSLKNIDVAFVCMNLPYTMPPDEAAEAVRAFHPKIVYPYHYRGSDLSVFQKALAGSGIDVRLLDWYYKG